MTPRQVPGYPGLTVDETGTVYGSSGKPLRTTLNPRKSLFVSCPGGTPEGYRSAPVAQLVCIAFHGPKPSHNHWCKNLSGDVYDNRPENVAWVLKRSARKGV